MDVEIRLLGPNEAVPIELLLLADPSEEIILNYIDRGECFIATNNNEIIGALVIIKTRPETIEIVNIVVKEDFQGKGIGKKLIDFAIIYAKEQREKTMEIGTGNSSIFQLLLYQKCGFRIVGVDPDFFIRHYKDEIYENGIQCRDMIRLRLEL
ncbi:GNAT family N-acetyltransferase [Paenibacillus sp. Marseille-P2973]|uniref:GNAT family N-acetyltransferase n=1 Tax=Paenibacillus sp. Marseille-P2973 TaxID=1871032 RepID=UPI001B38ACD0|nr:GNAT family N-acetyltransferase [Paenibacillus sp. Marseille-P2973]MBQ4898776.1 GNAT family N-acetyltransferase [Paenibacillus sp. Marseille-P2973]